MPRTFDRKAVGLEKWTQVATAAVALVERIATADAGDTIHGSKWQQGMLDHYIERARQLLAHPPQGAQGLVRKLTKRLNTAVRNRA